MDANVLDKAIWMIDASNEMPEVVILEIKALKPGQKILLVKITDEWLEKLSALLSKYLSKGKNFAFYGSKNGLKIILQSSLLPPA
jgi:hypothetical protein